MDNKHIVKETTLKVEKKHLVLTLSNLISTIVGTPSPFYKEGGGGVEFLKFSNKAGSDFSHKKGGVGKIEGCLKKTGIAYFHTN